MQRDLDCVVAARVRDAHRNTRVGCAAESLAILRARGVLAIVRVSGGSAPWGSEFNAGAWHVEHGVDNVSSEEASAMEERR